MGTPRPKALTARNFRMVVGSKPSVLLDAKSWIEAATTRFSCTAYRYGDIYVRDLGRHDGVRGADDASRRGWTGTTGRGPIG